MLVIASETLQKRGELQVPLRGVTRFGIFNTLSQ
jgi:hypothetical protein